MHPSHGPSEPTAECARERGNDPSDRAPQRGGAGSHPAVELLQADTFASEEDRFTGLVPRGPRPFADIRPPLFAHRRGRTGTAHANHRGISAFCWRWFRPPVPGRGHPGRPPSRLFRLPTVAVLAADT